MELNSDQNLGSHQKSEKGSLSFPELIPDFDTNFPNVSDFGRSFNLKLYFSRFPLTFQSSGNREFFVVEY